MIKFYPCPLYYQTLFAGLKTLSLANSNAFLLFLSPVWDRAAGLRTRSATTRRSRFGFDIGFLSSSNCHHPNQCFNFPFGSNHSVGPVAGAHFLQRPVDRLHCTSPLLLSAAVMTGSGLWPLCGSAANRKFPLLCLSERKMSVCHPLRALPLFPTHTEAARHAGRISGSHPFSHSSRSRTGL